MTVVDTAANIAKTIRSYKLMDQAVRIEQQLVNGGASEDRAFSHISNRGESEIKSGSGTFLAWWSADDYFNDLRKNYTLKSYHEAVADARFVLRTSSNNEDRWYAKNDIRSLTRYCRGAKYVVMGNDEKHAYVPATSNNDIIPFLRCLKSHDPAFKSIGC